MPRVVTGFQRWWRLDDLRKKLMYVGYDALELENLQPLRDEVAAKLKETKWDD